VPTRGGARWRVTTRARPSTDRFFSFGDFFNRRRRRAFGAARSG
jgi:hypothetical protein